MGSTPVVSLSNHESGAAAMSQLDVMRRLRVLRI